MAKFDVTPELGEVIRLTRIQNNIASKTLAASLERSPAYISKLEKGEIKTIEESELTSILEYIIPEADSFSQRLELVTETLVRHYSRDDFNQQLWLQNYDWVTRRISIPPQLIQELHDSYDLSSSQIVHLITEINFNSDLPEEIRNDKSIPFNQWRARFTDGVLQCHYIKLKIEPQEIIRVLNGSLSETNYLLLFALVRFLFRMTHYTNQDVLDEQQEREINQFATKKLSDYNVRTIVNQVWKRRDDVIQSDIQSLLSSQNPEIGSLSQEIMSLINILTRFNLPAGVESLRCLNSSLEWDTAFTEKMMRLPYFDLEGVSHTNKKQLLAEIEALIQKYKNLPAAQKSLESYD